MYKIQRIKMRGETVTNILLCLTETGKYFVF